MKKQFFRFPIFLLLLTILLSAFAPCVCAVEPIDLTADVSLQVTLRSGETAIPGAVFSIYRVGDIDESAKMTLLDGFSDYTGRLGGTASDWDAAAEAMAKLAADQKLAAVTAGKTDAEGKVTFDKGLTPGLYLLTCVDTEFEEHIYTALPALVCLPNLDDETGLWSYDVAVKAKAGEPKPVPGPVKPPEPVPPVLPQTGLLWWPVPALLISGLFFVLVGVVRRNAKNEE